MSATTETRYLPGRGTSVVTGDAWLLVADELPHDVVDDLWGLLRDSAEDRVASVLELLVRHFGILRLPGFALVDLAGARTVVRRRVTVVVTPQGDAEEPDERVIAGSASAPWVEEELSAAAVVTVGIDGELAADDDEYLPLAGGVVRASRLVLRSGTAPANAARVSEVEVEVEVEVESAPEPEPEPQPAPEPEPEPEPAPEPEPQTAPEPEPPAAEEQGSLYANLLRGSADTPRTAGPAAPVAVADAASAETEPETEPETSAEPDREPDDSVVDRTAMWIGEPEVESPPPPTPPAPPVRPPGLIDGIPDGLRPTADAPAPAKPAGRFTTAGRDALSFLRRPEVTATPRQQDPAPPVAPPPPPEPELAPTQPDAFPVPEDEDESLTRTVNRAAPAQSGAAAESVLAVRCPAGHYGPQTSAVCRVCGAVVPSQEPVRVARPPLGRMVLPSGEVLSLDKSAVFGRAPSNKGVTEPRHAINIASYGKTISRMHLEVVLDGWRVMVRDLGSTSGTTVTRPGQDPEALRPDELFELESGTEIDLAGAYVMRFEVVA